jgi:hypothetical protein
VGLELFTLELKLLYNFFFNLVALGFDGVILVSISWEMTVYITAGLSILKLTYASISKTTGLLF